MYAISVSMTQNIGITYLNKIVELFISKYFKYLLLAVLIYTPLFGHLDSLVIRVWDESRLAVNAFEMLQNGNYIVTHYEGKPDMWNTKPPLLIWIQVLFMKTIGVNVLAVRLPSAIAAFITSLTLLFFLKHYLKSFWLGFIAVLVLITSQGYIGIHSARTGDYDALLTLFTTLYSLFFFVFIQSKKNKHLYYFYIFVTLAVLTKSIAGVLMIPALFAYAISQKQVINTITNKHFYSGLILSGSVILGYYLLREHYNPGFIEAVKLNELGGRFSNIIEHHEHGFWYYYDLVVGSHYTYWHLLIPCGLLIGGFSREEIVRKISLFSFLIILFYFLTVSTAQTKLFWYDIPLYPFFAISVSIAIYFIFNLLNDNIWIRNKLSYNIVPYIFLFLVMITPYKQIIDKTYLPKENNWNLQNYNLSYYFKDVLKSKESLAATFYLFEGYNAHILFYEKLLTDKGYQISRKDYHQLEKGDLVVANQEEVLTYLAENYQLEMIEETKRIKAYRILDIK